MNIPVEDRPLLLEMLLANSVKRSSGCLEWTGGRNKDGYGHTSFHHESVDVHRLMYAVSVGPIPSGMCVLHRCDNPPCFLPEHLFAGTRAENMQDKMNKGRHDCRGARNGRAKLTDAMVVSIRAEYASGNLPMRIFARRYGVSVNAIHRAVSGIGWKHVATERRESDVK